MREELRSHSVVHFSAFPIGDYQWYKHERVIHCIYLNEMDDEISLQYGTIGNIDKQTHCQNVPNASNTFRMEQMYIIRQIYTLKVKKQVPR